MILWRKKNNLAHFILISLKLICFYLKLDFRSGKKQCACVTACKGLCDIASLYGGICGLLRSGIYFAEWPKWPGPLDINRKAKTETQRFAHGPWVTVIGGMRSYCCFSSVLWRYEKQCMRIIGSGDLVHGVRTVMFQKERAVLRVQSFEVNEDKG